VTDCNSLRVTIDDRPALRAEETVPAAGFRSLTVRPPQNGGIYVIGSDSGTYDERACKASAFQEDLDMHQVRVVGTEVTADAPDGGRWMVYFLVRAPRGATLGLRTHNGPITLRNVNGTVNAETTNGPISIDGGSGTTKLTAQNGPISVKLRGSSWDGSLDARTQNGPVSLSVPASFRSGVVVEAEGHGPVSCRSEACRQVRRSWDDEDNRKIQLGSGPTTVHLSTYNGPVTVRDSED